jgi:hypothetical protein
MPALVLLQLLELPPCHHMGALYTSNLCCVLILYCGYCKFLSHLQDPADAKQTRTGYGSHFVDP